MIETVLVAAGTRPHPLGPRPGGGGGVYTLLPVARLGHRDAEGAAGGGGACGKTFGKEPLGFFLEFDSSNLSAANWAASEKLIIININWTFISLFPPLYYYYVQVLNKRMRK